MRSVGAPRGTTVRASVGAGAAMLLVGTSTAVSATVADYPVLVGQALRYALAAAILLAVLRHRRPPRVRLTPRDVLLVAALAATGLAGFNLCLVEATRHAGPAMIGAVIGGVPVVLALAGPLLERRRPAPRTVTAAVVVALGTAVAAGLGSGSLTGLLLSVGALAGEVAFSLLAVPLLPKLGPLRVAAYPAALAAPLLLVAGLALDGPAALRLPTPGEAAAFVYLGAVVTAAAFFLWYDALGRLGADRAGLFAGLVPVGALLTTVVLGLGHVGTADVAGALVVGAGVVLGTTRRSDLPRPSGLSGPGSRQARPAGQPADARSARSPSR
ncbi:DMT family transporter [Krasilnikoviella flava]|uniref:Permease of the drug/metabolite transporter (DMT) superfamily n=1 Tax=Krasilnikoviella flava TaxID=526729 RepID=A0A1T5JZQ7_9MICO|nr:DMT family transporter [Krasilnikoviella flava]SKC56775.1 Permease of the drug/metabolite transporter (DMT) superfamily [Krasilnikoviella flava]